MDQIVTYNLLDLTQESLSTKSTPFDTCDYRFTPMILCGFSWRNPQKKQYGIPKASPVSVDIVEQSSKSSTPQIQESMYIYIYNV